MGNWARVLGCLAAKDRSGDSTHRKSMEVPSTVQSAKCKRQKKSIGMNGLKCGALVTVTCKYKFRTKKIQEYSTKTTTRIYLRRAKPVREFRPEILYKNQTRDTPHKPDQIYTHLSGVKPPIHRRVAVMLLFGGT